LRTSEIRYRRLFEAARDGILILDAASRITDANPFMSDLLGYSHAAFMGKELWEIGFFADKDASKQAIAELNATGYLRTARLPLKTAGGELRDVEFISNVYEEDGKRVIQCNIRHNTGRERRQVEIQAAEERFQSLFEHGPDGIIISSPEKYYLDANESMCRMLGYERDELIGMHAADVVAESEVEFLVPALDEIKGESDYYREWQFRRKDGTEFPGEVLATIMPDGNLLAMIRDITTRKQGVDSLQQQADLLEQSFDAIFTWEVGNQINYWNRGAEQLYGFTKAEAIDKSSHELLRTEREGSIEEFEQDLITAGRWEGELRHTTKDGRRITVESRHAILPRADGRLFVMETNRDITERKVASTEHERLAALVEGSNDAIIGKDLKGTIINWNPAAERMFGYSRQEIVGNSISVLVPPDRVDEERAIHARILRGEIIDHFATVRIDKYGKPIHISATISPIKDAAGKIIGASKIVRNTSTLHRVEEERKVIFEIVRGAITTRGLDEFLKLVHASIGKIVYAENCIVMLHDPATDTFNFAFWADKQAPPPSSRAVGKSFGGLVLRTGMPLLLTKETKKRLVERGEAKLAGTPSSSWLGVPLRMQDVVIGVMVVQHYEDENSYDQRDLEFLSSVGDQIALAIERKRAEQSLRESEGRYRSVVETASDAIVTIDEVNEIIFINNAAEKIFGYSVDQMKGCAVTMLIPDYPNDRDHPGIDSNGGSEHKGLKMDEMRLAGLHHDGHEIPLELSFSEFTQDGRRYFTGLIKDVTERRRAEDAQAKLNVKIDSQRRRLNNLVSDIPGIVWEAADLFSSGKHGSNFVSDYVTDMLGYSVEEWLSIPNFWLTIVHPNDKERVTQQAKADLAAGNDSIREFRWIRKDGEVIWVEARTAIIQAEDGNAIGVRGVTIDITERKRAEGARKAISGIIEAALTTPDLDEYLDLVHRSIGQIVYSENCFVMLYDPVTEVAHYEFWVDQHDERPPAGPLGKGFGSHVLRTRVPLLLTEDSERRMYEDGEAEQIGSSSASWLGVPLRTQSQTIGVLVLQHYEKTNAYSQRDLEFLSSVGDQIALAIERKRAEEALNRSEERYRELVENALDIIYTHDLKGNYTSVNKASERLTGYSEGESLAMNIADMVAPEFIEKVKVMIAAKLAGDEVTAYEVETIAKDGHRIALEVNTRIIYENGIAVSVQGIARDITDRKHANQALQESEDRYRTLFETSPDGVAMFDMHMKVLVANGRSAEIFGYPNASEMIGKDAFDLIAPKFVDRAKRNFDAIREFGKLAPVESLGIRADGNEFAVEFSATLVRDTDRQPIGVLGVVRDITERKQAEEKLIRSESNLAKSQEIAHLGSWEMDIPESGDVNLGDLRWSDEVFRIFGYTPGEIEINNDAFFDAVHPGDRASVTEAMAEALRDGKDFRIDHRILLRDGSERSVHEHSEIIVDKKTGKPIRMIGTIQDVTSGKQLEEQLRHSQKMEAVGVLAGGIAHDFNNLLTAINGYGDLTLRKMPPDDPLRGNVQEIRNAGERAAALTEQLLSFSRKNVLQPKVHNLNPLLTEIEKMLRRIVRENIELRTVLDPELGNINADPGQIEQVIMNLAVNARDAMPNGGMLTIETQNIYLDKDYVSQHIAITPGRFVKMTVTDNGEGMDEKTQRRAFEPFFSTKEVGKGTGLGLSTVFGIVKQSGGDIMVYSEVGHGTTFKIYLPRVDDDVEKSRWKEDIDEGSYSGSETILLVEDEGVVRTLVRDVLKSNGYRVLETASGSEALSVCGTYSEPIQLLLTDVIMPKMSGSELKVMVTEQRPEIKVLFMSGYTDDAISAGGFLDRGTAFIEKPFSPDSLARKVRETLDS